MSDPKMTTIYVLKDPRYKEDVDAIRYVGQTTQKLSQRLYGHISDTRRDGPYKKFPRSVWVSKLVTVGIRPTIEAIAVVPLSDAKTEETKYIDYYLTMGCDLLNAMDGYHKRFFPRTERRQREHGKLIIRWLNSGSLLHVVKWELLFYIRKAVQYITLLRQPSFSERSATQMHRMWDNPKQRMDVIEKLRRCARTPEARKRASEAATKGWQNAERREKQSRLAKARWQDASFRERATATMRAAAADPKEKDRKSAASKIAWTDPKAREIRVRGMREGLLRHYAELKSQGEKHREWTSKLYSSRDVM